MILLLKLVLAHLVGDFLLQPRTWVEAKNTNKLKAWQLYVHTLIHGALIMLLVWDLQLLVPALVITLTHGIIDAIKVLAQRESTKRWWFVMDQGLHAIVILVAWWTVETPLFTIELSDRTLLIITALVFITTPVSVVIKTLISHWMPATNTDGLSLQNAGKLIGILERLLVFTFAITGHWDSIGFLMAAKSIFRFGDLTNARDLKLTEYVLIGTLLSFGIAIVMGLIVNYFSQVR